jgi:hypothetical protein
MSAAAFNGRVKLVDQLPHFRKLALDFAHEQIHVRRYLQPSPRRQPAEHRIERLHAAAELLALCQLVQDALEHGRRARQKRERPTRQYALVVTVQLAALALT